MEGDKKHPDIEEVKAHHGAKAKEIRDAILAGYKTIVDNIR